jgi:hypothetical protein
VRALSGSCSGWLAARRSTKDATVMVAFLLLLLLLLLLVWCGRLPMRCSDGA